MEEKRRPTITEKQLMSAADILNPREQRIIRLRHGIDGGKVQTLEEIGREYKITRERVRQIEARATQKIMSRMK